MSLKAAIEVLMQAAATKIAGAGCGLPGGHPVDGKGVVLAMQRVTYHLKGREMTFNEMFNYGIPGEMQTMIGLPPRKNQKL